MQLRTSALLLSPEAPYPMIGGGPLRTASVLEWMARNFVTDVITFRQPGHPDPREAFPVNLVRSVHVIDLPFHSKSRFARIARNLTRAARSRPPLFDRFSGFDEQIRQAIGGRRYQLGVIEHFWCAAYEKILRDSCENVWLDLHNIESVWHESLAHSEPFPLSAIHRRFASAYRKQELAAIPRFEKVLVTSESDLSRICKIASGPGETIYPNAVPLVPIPQKQENDELIFTGNLEYQPNLSALRFFVNQVWPDLHKRWPNLTFVVAGKNKEAAAPLVYGRENIQLAGPMSDAVLRIAGAKVAVVPMLAGSGTRIKILEAWAAATPVVSTTLGAEGLTCQPGRDVVIANTPQEFARSVSLLLSDLALRRQIGRAGRLLYENFYTWPEAWKQLDSALAPFKRNTNPDVGVPRAAESRTAQEMP